MKNDSLDDYQYFVLGLSILNGRDFFEGTEQEIATPSEEGVSEEDA